jgi:subtilisin family serine protease
MKSYLCSRTKILGILLGFLVLAFSSGCQKDIIETDNALDPVSDEVTLKGAKIENLMVITTSETLPAGFEKVLSAYGQIVNTIPEIGVVVVKPANSNSAGKIARLRGVQTVVPDLKVRWIEPDKFVSEANPLSIGDDEPGFWYQWGMDAIDAPEAWNAGFTGIGARVFILDAGIDADNPDLAPNLNTALSASFVEGEGYNVRPGSFFNHGTHVAGIIAAADNKFGVIGVAPDCEIVAVKVLSEFTGSGYFSSINAGIVYAADHGADVINMSLGATFNRNGFYLDENDVLQKIPAVYLQNLILSQQRAVNYAVKKGAVVVVSAGNDYMNADGNASLFIVPADLENVIAISATAPYGWALNQNGSLDIPASYTNYGKSLVALAAPGGDSDFPGLDSYGYPYFRFDMILSSGAGGPTSYPFYFASGTSMASPHVAGVAALIIGKNGGQMDPHEVTKQLFKTADKIDGQGMSPYFGYGRVNAFRAITE